MTSLGTTVWEKYVLWVYVELKFLVSYMSCLGKALESLANKIHIFGDLKNSGVSGFSLCAMAPV